MTEEQVFSQMAWIDSFNYSLFHEAMQLGYMIALKRAIGVIV